MANSTIVCSYKATAVGGQVSAALVARMAAVPASLTIPSLNGLRYTADTTIAVDNTVTRTLTFSMVPVSPATATCELDPGNVGSPLYSVTITAIGSGYEAAPIPVLTSVSPPNIPSVLTPTMKLTDGISIAMGVGYHSGSTTVSFVGGQLAPGGTQGTATLTISAGVVAAVTVTSGGGPYNRPPKAIITDTHSSPGSGAILSMGLGMSGLSIVGQGGQGYGAAPTISFTPLFKAKFPDGTNQASALTNFMTQEFMTALNGDVFAVPPVIS